LSDLFRGILRGQASCGLGRSSYVALMFFSKVQLALLCEGISLVGIDRTACPIRTIQCKNPAWVAGFSFGSGDREPRRFKYWSGDKRKGSNEKTCPARGQGFSADGDWGFRARDAASTIKTINCVVTEQQRRLKNSLARQRCAKYLALKSPASVCLRIQDKVQKKSAVLLSTAFEGCNADPGDPIRSVPKAAGDRRRDDRKLDR
jgi:hypothetical protein